MLIFEKNDGAFTILLADTGQLQHFGIKNIAAEGRDQRIVIFQHQCIYCLLILVYNYHAHLQAIELLDQCLGHAVVSKNKNKRFIHCHDGFGEP